MESIIQNTVYVYGVCVCVCVYFYIIITIIDRNRTFNIFKMVIVNIYFGLFVAIPHSYVLW